MERFIPPLEVGEPITKERMELIDSFYPSPSQRATKVLTLLNLLNRELAKENKRAGRPPAEGLPTMMDQLCFAVEYLGQQAIAIGDPDLLHGAINVSRTFYAMHYSDPVAIFGIPELEDETLQEEGPEVSGSERGGDHVESPRDHGEPPEVEGDG